MADKDQTEYSYTSEKRRAGAFPADEASTTLPSHDKLRPPYPRAKQKLRALALTGTDDASGPVSDRIRLGQNVRPTS